MTAHILDLPVELLVAIFELAIEGEILEYVTCRTILALVSSRFHGVVRDSPSLWTRIGSEQSVNLNALAIARSGNQPLEITFPITFPLPSPTGSPPAYLSMNESFKMACSQLSRWRSAVLYFGNEEGPLAALAKPAPRLEEVQIGRGGPGSLGAVVNMFGGQAERLISLRLTEVSIPWNGKMLRNLQVLELMNIRDFSLKLEELMRILALSPELTVLKLEGVDFNELSSPDSTLVQLPHLHTLELCDIHAHFVAHILRHVRSPPCEALTIHYELHATDDIPSLVQLLRPFIPPPSDEGEDAELDVGYRYCEYALTETPLNITLDGVPPSILVNALLSTLGPKFLALPTRALLHHIGEVDEVLTRVDTTSVTNLNVINLGTQTDVVLQRLGKPKETEDGHRRWLFPALQDLYVGMHDATPGELSEMLRTRYQGACDNREAGRPLLFTTLKTTGSLPQHNVDFEAVEATIGPDALTWGWRDDAAAELEDAET